MTARPIGITGWALRVAIFVALAGAFAIFQVDRQSRDRLGLMAYVPPGLGGFTDANIARPLALVDPDMAVDRATAALRHRPIDAGNLAAYALAAVEAGDEARAGQALTLAAQRGWRDTYTQVMVVGSALSTERWDVAAQRVDALAKLHREEEAIYGSLSLILQKEAAREELALRMVSSVSLVDYVAKFLGEYPEFGTQVARTFALAEQEGEIECGQIARVARLLLANDMSEPVRGLWPSRCARQQPPNLAFRFVEAREDPFAWIFPSEGGVSLREGSEVGTLDLRNRDPLRRRFAFRYAMLAEGDHRLTLTRDNTARGPSGPASRPADLQVAIRCVSSDEGLRSPLFNGDYDGIVDFTVPEGCATQHLSLSLGQGRVTDLSIVVD